MVKVEEPLNLDGEWVIELNKNTVLNASGSGFPILRRNDADAAGAFGAGEIVLP